MFKVFVKAILDISAKTSETRTQWHIASVQTIIRYHHSFSIFQSIRKIIYFLFFFLLGILILLTQLQQLTVRGIFK